VGSSNLGFYFSASSPTRRCDEKTSRNSVREGWSNLYADIAVDLAPWFVRKNLSRRKEKTHLSEFSSRTDVRPNNAI
jgi:hypothetical protein